MRQMPLTEENIRIVAKQLMTQQGTFHIKDFHPHFAIIPSQGAVAQIVKTLGYVPSQEDKNLFIKKRNPNLTIGSVVLSDEKKEAIRVAISQEQNSKLIFEKWGFEEVFEKGTAITLLFWGIPGTGKTLMAQAIAEETNSELGVYSTADIESFEPGGAERTIKRIFGEAQNLPNGRKRVILFDECDSLLTDRNELGAILAAQTNVLLDEIEQHTGIVIFTTNRLGKLDPAFERRITTKVEFPFPNKKQRKAIWQRLLPKKAPLARDVNLDKLAEYALAGGNIKNAILSTARKAAYFKAKKITMELFVEEILKERQALQAFMNAYNAQPHYDMWRRRTNEPVPSENDDNPIDISEKFSTNGEKK